MKSNEVFVYFILQLYCISAVASRDLPLVALCEGIKVEYSSSSHLFSVQFGDKH